MRQVSIKFSENSQEGRMVSIQWKYLQFCTHIHLPILSTSFYFLTFSNFCSAWKLSAVKKWKLICTIHKNCLTWLWKIDIYYFKINFKKEKRKYLSIYFFFFFSVLASACQNLYVPSMFPPFRLVIQKQQQQQQ